MSTKQLKPPVPDVCIDPDLNEYDGQVLFPGQAAKANEMFKKVGLPKQPASRNYEAA